MFLGRVYDGLVCFKPSRQDAHRGHSQFPVEERSVECTLEMIQMNGYTIEEINPVRLSEYAMVPISFNGNTILEVKRIEDCFGGFILKEKNVEPFFKDYDSFESPLAWPERFDLSHWRLFIAHSDESPVGGAALVMNSSEIMMLDGKKNLACLWDIRVHPTFRGKGIGRVLFRTAVQKARESGCRWMCIETQNNNVAANRFYRSQGCHLAQIHLHGYCDVPGREDEIMLIWWLNL